MSQIKKERQWKSQENFQIQVKKSKKPMPIHQFYTRDFLFGLETPPPYVYGWIPSCLQKLSHYKFKYSELQNIFHINIFFTTVNKRI
jgi:hypothetical protein